MAPRGLIIPGPKHHYSLKIAKNKTFPRTTQSVKVLFGVAHRAGEKGLERECIGAVELDRVLRV